MCITNWFQKNNIDPKKKYVTNNNIPTSTLTVTLYKFVNICAFLLVSLDDTELTP